MSQQNQPVNPKDPKQSRDKIIPYLCCVVPSIILLLIFPQKYPFVERMVATLIIVGGLTIAYYDQPFHIDIDKLSGKMKAGYWIGQLMMIYSTMGLLGLFSDTYLARGIFAALFLAASILMRKVVSSLDNPDDTDL